MDDVQFLERKTRTEEEFFHTFNALHDGGRQIVVSSDRAPQDLQALEDRLRERFQAGLVADIRPPGLATRIAILRKRAQHDHVELEGEGALEVIAERVDSNVRALEGALIRVVAYSSLTGRPLTAELASEVLRGSAARGRARADAAHRARDPGGDVQVLRHLERGAALLLAYPAPGLAAPAGDVPRARADGAVAAGDRTPVRRTRPLHGPARMQAHLRAHRLRRGLA